MANKLMACVWQFKKMKSVSKLKLRLKFTIFIHGQGLIYLKFLWKFKFLFQFQSFEFWISLSFDLSSSFDLGICFDLMKAPSLSTLFQKHQSNFAITKELQKHP